MSSLLTRPRSRLLRRPALIGAAVLFAASVVLTGLVAPPKAAAANLAFPDLPVGFAKVELAQGLKNPTAIAFGPGGDIYIAQQRGAILLDRGGVIQTTPVLSISTDLLTETGVLGMALDPNFASNGYMYLAYTTPDEHAQLSRFTITGGGTTGSPASEVVFWRGDQFQSAHHSINDVHIGPDGKLWVSVGDNDPMITNGATLSNAYGKILRFNLDGTIPADNPFLNVPGAVPSIYAYGLRNPFRFTFLPNGKAMTEDTGSSYWEELNTIARGGNFGWDFYEGNCFSCGYINPTYAYGHLPTDSAASAMAAYTGNVFPTAYANTVFFGDYNRLDIEAVKFDPTYQTEISDTVFDSSVGTIADLQEGPDGNLYYVSIFEGQFWKIYPSGSIAPTAAASASPAAGPGPLHVGFSSAGSSDAYGLPLTYSWDFGDGSAVSTSANPSHTYNSNGTYTATLTVNNGTSTAQATTGVVVGQSPPNATLSTPTSGATYNGGQAISFGGSATDATDGTEPGSAFSWQVDFMTNGVAQPFYSLEVPGPFYTVAGVTSGSFQIPTDVSQTPTSFYRITMTVTDSLGLKTVTTRDIHPNTTSWTVNANVPNSMFFVDGFLKTGSFTTTDVVGIQHVLMGIPSQVVAGTTYRLNGWADGSAISDSFTSGASPATYTERLDPVTGTLPSGWTSVDIGSPLMTGGAYYSAADSTFYVDGSGLDVFNTNEQLHYVYQTLNGDGTIVARVRYQSNSDPWAKAGLMFMATPTAGATWIDALVTPDVSSVTPNINGVGCTANGCSSPLPPVIPTVGNGVRMQYFTTGSVPSPAPLTGYASPNKWLKLQRSGNTFTSWQSNDGVSWNLIGTRVLAMPTTATVGMWVTSHSLYQVSSLAFDNVSISGAVGAATNDFSMSSSGSTVPVAPGTTGSTTIGTAVQSGSAETIALSASGLPAGATAGFAPTSVGTGASSTLTFTVPSSVALGSYPVTVTGTAPSDTNTTMVTLLVTQPLNHLVLSPATATVSSGVAQPYTAEGFDAANQDLGDFTAETTFGIAGGGSCASASCSSTVVGSHKVTGTDGSATGTATLHVTALTGATYHPVAPTRVLDSRNGTGGISTPFSVHVPKTFTVPGLPSNAVAVTGNLTVTGQTSVGYLYIGPAPVASPTSSNLNFPMGDDRANAVTVQLGAGNTLSITLVAPWSGPTAQAIFDLTGYFTSDATGATYHPVAPTRVLDSRNGTGGISTPFSVHVPKTFTVPGLPSNAVAVTGNLTVTGQTSVGYLYIGPAPVASPTSSNLNFPMGDDRANAVTVQLGAGNTLSITLVAPWSGPTAQAIFDLTGYFV
jgi:glucose/arabinose dehydrogenase